MKLEQNLRLFLPLTPNPIDQNMKKISDALDFAINLHIKNTFVAVGFGASFISQAPQNNFIQNLGVYLETIMSPIITTASGLQSTVGNLAAWASVIPSIVSLISSPPSFMAGELAIPFWSAILITITEALPPPPPEG